MRKGSKLFGRNLFTGNINIERWIKERFETKNTFKITFEDV